jgi:hypothetical protein
MIVDVRIANVLEEERAIVAHEPANTSEEEFTERWMYIEEVGSLEVV